MLKVIREFSEMYEGEYKVEINIPCFMEGDYWERVKEAYGISVHSSCGDKDHGSRGFVRTKAQRSRELDQSLVGKMSHEQFEDYTADFLDKRDLWDRLELKLEAQACVEDPTEEMLPFIDEEQYSAKELHSLRLSEIWFDSHMRKVLARKDTVEGEEMRVWLGVKVPRMI
jgi:hypothetical protein